MSVWDTIGPRRTFADLVDRRTLGTVAFAATTLVALAVFNQLLARAYWTPGSWRVYAPLAAGVVGAALFATVRYSAFTPLLKASLRASAAGLLVMLLLERPDFTLADAQTAARAAEYVNLGYLLALACAAFALFRPAFIVPTALYIISTRHLVQAISGLPMSVLDIRYMIDMALYLTLFGLGVVKLGPRLHPWLASPDRQDAVVGAAFGLHLANYFWSGLAKVLIGPTPWYWIVNNKTFNQIPYTIESGIAPLGHLPWLADAAYQVLQFACVPLNAVIVCVQLLAIVCVFRVGWLKVASLLFDALHLGIYVFGGLFFWPWIWNNITILWAAEKAKDGLSRSTKVACVAAILLGAPALKLNEAAWLAWFDVADARQVYFEAVTKDGRGVKAPSAYFLSHAYSVSHAYMGSQPVAGQYAYTMLASADSVERNKTSGTCPVPDAPLAVETPAQRTERQARLSRLLRAHHQKMLGREAALGLGSYYLHLHHHPSNPFLYSEFNTLSLRDVVGYRLVLESVCHRLDQGRVVKTVRARNAEYFDVR